MKRGLTSNGDRSFFCQPGISCRDPCFACLVQDNMDHHHLCCTLDIPVEKMQVSLKDNCCLLSGLVQIRDFFAYFPTKLEALDLGVRNQNTRIMNP